MSDVTPGLLAAVSAHTGVPVEFLSGDNIAAVWDSARSAIDWKTSTAPQAPPQPPTAAVSPSSQPYRIPMQQLVPGDDWTAAWRAGRLTPKGVPAPPPRRNNGHSRSNEP
jgi:D-aminopeptidase